MLAALKEPIEVHLTGGGGLDVNQLVIAAAALGAAVLTVLFANRRHRQQLEGNQRLHREQLDHDRELRAADLAHDRLMRSREAVRDTLDTVTQMAMEAMNKITSFSGHIDGMEVVRKQVKEWEQNDPEADTEPIREAKAKVTKDLKEAYRKSRFAAAELLAPQVQLRLRLPGDHPIVVDFESYKKVLKEWLDAEKAGLERARTEDEAKVAKEKLDAAVQAYANYVKACRGWYVEDEDP